FLGVDVVRDDVDVVIVPELLAKCFNKCRLARTDGPSDSDAEGAVIGILAKPGSCACELAHDRNNLVYCVSCAMDAKSTMIAAEPRSSIVASLAFALADSIAGSSSAMACCPSICPRGMSLTPAFTRFAT